jgi:hypothetical protein
MAISIIVVTGASGAGKTAVVSALAALELPGVRCFHFDSIGVPTTDAMEREHGGPDQWQAWATNQWLARLAALGDTTRVAVLDAQTRPSTVLTSAGAGSAWYPHVVLFDCSTEVRTARLCGPRGQPELATGRMATWAAYLRGQADALGLPIIDTTAMSIADATQELRAFVRWVDSSTAPAD